MATKHTVTLTCDICKTESNESYSWARIDQSGSTSNMVLMPNSHYDICPDCWMKDIHPLIHPRRAKVASATD